MDDIGFLHKFFVSLKKIIHISIVGNQKEDP